MKLDDYKKYALPAGWKWQNLGECCEPKLVKGEQGATPYLEIGDINIESKQYTYSDKPAVKGALVAEEGDVLISRVRPTRGAITVLRESKSHVSSALSVLAPRYGVLSSYIFYYLAWNKEFLKYLGENCTGTMYPTISKDFVHAYRIPVAPIDQQKHIVAEIEKQFSRLDEAVANLKRVKANLKRYKAAVLKAAVEGRLVETEAELARKITPSPLAGEGGGEGASYETGVQLLQRILETRRSQWKGKGKYKEPAAPDTADLPELPEGWVWASVQQLAEVQLGKMLDRQKHRSGKEHPYLRNINVRWDSVDSSDLLTMFFKEREFDRFGLRAGDVLVCEGGEPGRAAVWDGRALGMMYQKAIHRVRFVGGYQQRVLVFYLEFMAKTGRLERWFTGSIIKHFTRESFAQLPIPVAPAAEQIRIVAEVDRRLSLIRETETQIDANLVRADRLRQSILARAFSGTLGYQNTTDISSDKMTWPMAADDHGTYEKSI